MIVRSRIVRAAATAAVAAVAVTGAALPALASTGPDVSGWQHPSGGAITWSKVKAAGSSFVFIKASEGTAYTNPYFAGDWRASGAAGLMHGAYHFARPSTAPGSAAAQARHFVAVIGNQRVKGTLPPSLDLEVSGGLSRSQLIAWTATFLGTVRALTGRTPMVYSYPYFWQTKMGATTAFRSYPLWGACYCSTPTTFGGAWTHWTFWQYSSTSRVSGVAGKVDMNKFNGSTTALRTLAYGGAATSGTPAPTPAPTPVSTSQSKRATTLALTAPATVPAYTHFTVSGRLTTSSGTALGNRSVLVRGRLVGSSTWRDITTVTTDATGRFSTTLRAPADAQVYGRYAGSTTLAAASSRAVTVTVTGGGQYGGQYGGYHRG